MSSAHHNGEPAWRNANYICLFLATLLGARARIPSEFALLFEFLRSGGGMQVKRDGGAHGRECEARARFRA
jgi:hypothetical protein